MARKATADTSSYWLPGFEPDLPSVPESKPTGSQVLQSLPLTPAVAPVVAADAEPTIIDAALVEATEETTDAAPSQGWRLCAVPSTPTPRVRFPRLRTADLVDLGGTAAKFDANVQAIEILARLEAEQRQAEPSERIALARYTGWGSQPAAFNLAGKDAAWASRAQSLQTLLDGDDYASAKASLNNSHYTPLFVIEAMWAAVSRLGFTGGRVLEPAAGVGHFIGAMPDELVDLCKVTAVEIDRLPGRVLQALYAPAGAAVHIAAFEKTQFPNGWFDLVIGNVPFGKYKVADTSNRPYAGFSIHNYFISRSLDLVRPGGLVVLITSSHTLESSNGAARHYLASQAHLLGAIRLPKGVFAEMAGTDVQADILILRKREGAEFVEGDWAERCTAPDGLIHPSAMRKYMRVSSWYAKHPEWLIGSLREESNGYEEVPTAVYDGDLESALRERVALLPQGIYRPAAPAEPALHAVVPADPGARPGTFQVLRGRVHRVEGSSMVDVHDQFNATQRARIIGMCAIRDHARALLDMQLAEDGEEELRPLRSMLNGTYDRFVAKYGCLSTRANALAFRRDADYPLLLSLEHYDEETATAQKAALFTMRTLKRVVAPTSADEPTAALAASMQWRGFVDLPYMAQLLCASEEAVRTALVEGGHIFQDPTDERWKTADEYLSGNVRVKLSEARMAGSAYQRNVDALEKVQPEDLPAALIEVRLGAVWIPAADIETFVREELELKDCKVAYSPAAGTWSAECTRWAAQQSVKASQVYGTKRMHAVELILCALNAQIPTVKDKAKNGDSYVVNPDETLAAREKLGLLKDRFAVWAFDDRSRRDRLCALYNELFNATRPRTFDGSHLQLPGFSACFKLHPHQPNAVWRIVQSGNTGLFHAVGAGKTAVCVIASMELRRLGFAAKPCHVVPNHMLAQYTAEFVRLYPQASVLMASKEDLEGDRRRELISRIATGDWDAVVITHASFERVKMSPRFVEGFVKEIIHEIELAARAVKTEDRSNRIIKQLEAMKKNWAVRLEKLCAQDKKDDLLTWEQLGIDWLFVDEAHLHKVRRVKLHA